MCGRFSLTAPPEAVREAFGFTDMPNFPPRYNIAPTQPVGIVRLENGARRFRLVRWGLIPSWVKDPKAFTLLINARSETAGEKPAFRNAMKRRRCLVPANGFYEWQARGKSQKQPYWVRPADGGVIGFAGIWEGWMGPNGEEMETAAILTTAANDVLKPIHHRVPVVIAPEAYDRWLDCANEDVGTIADLLAPPANDLFEPVPVSTRVNKVSEDDPGVQDRVTPAEAATTDAAEAARDPKPKAKAKATAASDQFDLF